MIHELPPIIELDIDVLIQQLSPEDARYLKEFCMIHFPTWLYKIIQREASMSGQSYEQFVRIACIEAIMNRVKERCDK